MYGAGSKIMSEILQEELKLKAKYLTIIEMYYLA